MLPVHGDLHTVQRMPWKVPRFSMDFLFREFSTPIRGSHGNSQILPLIFSSPGHSHWPEDLMESPRALLKILFHGDLCTAQRILVEFPGFSTDFLLTEASTLSSVHQKSNGMNVTIYTQYTISKVSYHKMFSTASLTKRLKIVSSPKDQ